MIAEQVLSIGRVRLTLGVQVARHLANTSPSPVNDIHPLVCVSVARHRVHKGAAIKVDILNVCVLVGITIAPRTKHDAEQFNCDGVA